MSQKRSAVLSLWILFEQVDEWQVIDKKKKLAVPNKGCPSEMPSDVKFENATETEFVINHVDGIQRGRGLGRGGLRFPRG